MRLSLEVALIRLLRRTESVANFTALVREGTLTCVTGFFVECFFFEQKINCDLLYNNEVGTAADKSIYYVTRLSHTLVLMVLLKCCE